MKNMNEGDLRILLIMVFIRTARFMETRHIFSESSLSYSKFVIFNIFSWNSNITAFVSGLHFQYITLTLHVSVISVVLIV